MRPLGAGPQRAAAGRCGAAQQAAWVPLGGRRGACEHASLTVTTIVISLAIICSEQTGYLGRTLLGCLERMQFRAMMTIGTNRPT